MMVPSMMLIRLYQFFLNVFTEFVEYSVTKNIILKRLIYSNKQSPVPEVVSSNPTGAIFDEIYFVLCNFRSIR